MPIVPVRKLGEIGVIGDLPHNELPPNAFSRSEAVSFRDGKAQKAKGHAVEFVFSDNGPTRWLQSWAEGGVSRFATCYESVISVLTGTTLTLPLIRDQANAALVLSASDRWQSDVFGEFCILNNGVNVPLYSWNSATSSTDGSVFREIPGWGASNSPGGGVAVIRSFKNFLMALGLSTDPYTVFWSDEGQPGAFPQSWDYSDTTKLAGFNSLSAADGHLVDGQPLGDSFIVYTQFATYAAVISGGRSIFSWRRLWPWGALNADCVVQFENAHFVVANEALLVHDGTSNRRVADQRVERQLFGEIADLSTVRCVRSLQSNEVIIYYATGSSVTPNRALIWNWQANTWGFRDLPNVCCIAEGGLSPSLLTFDSAEVATLPIDSAPWTSDELQATDSRRRLFMLTAEDDPGFAIPFTSGSLLAYGAIYRNETALSTFENYYSYVERTGLDLDEISQGTARQWFVRGVYPQMQGTGTVNVQIGAAQSANGPYQWEAEQSFSLEDGASYKVDTRLTGRYLGYRVGCWSGTPLAGNWDLSGLDLDLEDGGR